MKVTIKDYTYRSSVAVMGGKFMISLSAAHRQAAGVVGGEKADITVELDLALKRTRPIVEPSSSIWNRARSNYRMTWKRR